MTPLSVQRTDDFQAGPIHDLGVNLRRAHVHMAQQILDRPDVRASLEQMRRKGAEPPGGARDRLCRLRHRPAGPTERERRSQCRSTCGETRFAIPATAAALRTARWIDSTNI